MKKEDITECINDLNKISEHGELKFKKLNDMFEKLKADKDNEELQQCFKNEMEDYKKYLSVFNGIYDEIENLSL